MTKAVFKLDLDERFKRLSRPPIIEAVIHWQARAQTSFDPGTLRAALAQKLPEYVLCEPLQQLELLATVSDQSVNPVVQHQRGWLGYRLAPEDRRHIVQFLRDGIVFSRMEPYDNWEQFTTAAKRVWRVYAELANPLEITRLGVRFINHIATAKPETVGEFLNEPPTCPSNLPLKEFVYQSTFAVPMHPYEIRVIKLLQPSMLPQSSGLFIDCYVSTIKPLNCAEQEMDDALVRMRWLKNRVFFSLLTDQAVQSFA